jgi:hypothetical protein
MDRLLADLLEEYERNPSGPLARTIRLIREEIELTPPVTHDVEDGRWPRVDMVDPE